MNGQDGQGGPAVTVVLEGQEDSHRKEIIIKKAVSNSKKKPANADGSTKDKNSNSNQNNEENTTKS